MLWSLPGPSRWLQSLTRDCKEGHSGIVFCPSPERPEDLVDELEALLGRDVYSAEGVQFGDGSPARLAHELRQWLELPATSTGSIRDFARDPSLGHQTILIDSRNSALQQQNSWLELAGEFAAACRELPRTTRPRLWVIAAPTGDHLPHTPQSDVNLKMRWWWGVVSDMDTSIAASELGIDGDLNSQVVEIVRWDLEMLTDLRNWNGSVDSLSDYVTEPRSTEGVRGHATSGWRARPPASLIADWATGMVESWNDEISPHILAEAAWRDDAATSRVWLAQVARLTPLIEMERWRLATHLDDELRRLHRHDEWRTADITELEIGPLRKCYLDHLDGSLSPRRKRLLRELVDARNDLAHRRPLSHAAIISLRNLIRDDR